MNHLFSVPVELYDVSQAAVLIACLLLSKWKLNKNSPFEPIGIFSKNRSTGIDYDKKKYKIFGAYWKDYYRIAGQSISATDSINQHFLKYFYRLWWTWILLYIVRAGLGYLKDQQKWKSVSYYFWSDSVFNEFQNMDYWNELFGFLGNSINNISALFTLFCYLALSIPTFKSNDAGAKSFLMNRWGWVFLVVCIIFFEFTARLRGFVTYEEQSENLIYFSYVSGLLVSIALFLFVGKLDSYILKHELKWQPFSDSRPLFISLMHKYFSWIIVLLYAYAAIQPLFPFLVEEKSKSLVVSLLIFGLLMKILLWRFVSSLITKKECVKFSPLELYFIKSRDLYYRVESDYKHSFLKNYFPILYDSKSSTKENGYLGIEYIKISESLLGDFSDLENGLLVTEVWHNSAASASGIYPGDVLIGIDKNRISPSRTLGDLLQNKKAEERVIIFLDRNGEKRKFSAILSNYSETLKERIAEENKPFLGFDLLGSDGINLIAQKSIQLSMLRDKQLVGHRIQKMTLTLESGSKISISKTDDLQLIKALLSFCLPGDSLNVEYDNLVKDNSNDYKFKSKKEANLRLKLKGIKVEDKKNNTSNVNLKKFIGLTIVFDRILDYDKSILSECYSHLIKNFSYAINIESEFKASLSYRIKGSLLVFYLSSGFGNIFSKINERGLKIYIFNVDNKIVYKAKVFNFLFDRMQQSLMFFEFYVNQDFIGFNHILLIDELQELYVFAKFELTMRDA